MLGESKLWISFNYACVIAAYAMLGLSLIFMPVNLATKGYVAMGVLFERIPGNPGPHAAGTADQLAIHLEGGTRQAGKTAQRVRQLILTQRGLPPGKRQPPG